MSRFRQISSRALIPHTSQPDSRAHRDILWLGHLTARPKVQASPGHTAQRRRHTTSKFAPLRLTNAACRHSGPTRCSGNQSTPVRPRQGCVGNQRTPHPVPPHRSLRCRIHITQSMRPASTHQAARDASQDGCCESSPACLKCALGTLGTGGSGGMAATVVA